MEPGGESLWRKVGLKMAQENLFAALRAAFPANLDSIAVETDHGLNYTWRDLDRASAMMANLFDGLKLPKGSRIAVQVEKSVEAVMLYLATLRAGYVFLPLNTAYQSSEIEYFIATPSQRWWCVRVPILDGSAKLHSKQAQSMYSL